MTTNSVDRTDSSGSRGYRIPVRGFRSQLATMLRRAAAGEQLVITVDGQPVASVGPVAGPEVTIDALIASGQLVAPRRRDELPAGALDPQPVWAGTRLDQAFTELRGR